MYHLPSGSVGKIYNPPTPASFPGGFSDYNPSNNTLVLAGIGSNPSNGGLKDHYKYFAPRVGLAYRVDEKTVIRAGIGISYASLTDNTYVYNFPGAVEQLLHHQSAEPDSLNRLPKYNAACRNLV